jgi:predicted nucleotidyltransferase
MKKSIVFLMVTMIVGVLIAGCSKDGAEIVEPELSTNEMVDKMLEKVEQPMLMELPADQVTAIYHIDPDKLEEYSIRIPMMNVKTNEIAILKVKDAADLAEVEEAVKQRAENVQKQFETYLPDQYENAKNYQLVTKGNYVLFVISEEADELVKVYDGFFTQQ